MMYKKTIISFWLAAIVVLSTLDNGYALTNLLKNSGFETGTTFPEGWTASPSSPNLNYKWDNTVSATGHYSVSIESFSDTVKGKWTQTVPVTAGTVYFYSGHIRFDTAETGKCLFQIVFKSKTKQLIKVLNYKAHSGARLEFGNDYPDPLKIRVPEGGVYAEICLVLAGKGKAWFDDIFFGPVPVGDIAGTVSSEGDPLEGARVAIMGEPWGKVYETYTDVNGSYVIKDVPVAHPRYIVIASKNGFQDNPAGDIDIIGGSTVYQDFNLKPGVNPADLIVSFGLIDERIHELRGLIPSGAVIPSSALGYPPEVLPFLKPDEFIDSDHPDIINFAQDIMNSIPQEKRSDTREVVSAVFNWIIRNIERIGSVMPGEKGDFIPEFRDVTIAKYQLYVSGKYAWGNNFREYLYKPSELFMQRGGICIELGWFATALLRAVKIPAIACGGDGSLYWAQDPNGDGNWVLMDIAKARDSYRDSGIIDGMESQLNPVLFSVQNKPVMAGDWNMAKKSLFKKSATAVWYPYTQMGMQLAIADLQAFSLTGEFPVQQTFPPPTRSNPSNSSWYSLYYSFRISLLNIEQNTLTVSFSIPDGLEYKMLWTGSKAYWTNYPELVVKTWVEEISNPPAEGTDTVFYIKFDLTPILQ